MSNEVEVSWDKWIIFKNGFQFGVTNAEADAYVRAIGSGKAVAVIRGTALGNGLDQIMTNEQRIEWSHQKRGEWKCRYGRWHSKKEAEWECTCGRQH